MELYLEKFIKKQFKEIDEILSVDLRQIDSEKIHQLRLCFKKIRASNTLLNRINDSNSDEKDLKKLIQILKETHFILGKLRDCQVQKSLLAEFSETSPYSFPELEKELARKEKSCYFESVDILTEFAMKGKKKLLKRTRSIGNKLNKLKLAEKANDAVKRQLSKISRLLLTNSVSEEAYHSIRKSLKELGYIATILSKDLDKTELMIRSKWVKLPEQALGKWHDLVLFRDEILEFEITLSNQEDLIRYKSLIHQIQTEANLQIKRFRMGYDDLIMELEERL